MLTQNQIKTQLQIANCCGAKKVNTYIENLKVGKYCPEILKEANILFGFIDALKCYKIFSETNQLETYTFSIKGEDITTLQSWIDGLDEPRTLVKYATSCRNAAFGNYPNELPRTIEGYLDFVMSGINENIDPSTGDPTFAPFIFGYTMDWTFNGSEYLVTMTAENCDQLCPSAVWGFDINNVSLDETLFYVQPMKQTSICEYPYEDCITYEQVLNVLAAIKRICNGACTDYVNFQLN